MSLQPLSLHFKARVPVFDANVRVGHPHNGVSVCADRASLLREMDRHGVTRALIYHAQTEEISPTEGNLALESWIGDDGRLVPQWSVMPLLGSMAQIEALVAQGRVNSVRLHETKSVGVPFRPWAYDTLLRWLSERRIPVWIPFPDFDPDELVETLRAYPDLVTVLVGAHYAHHMLIRPVLRAVPNAHLELSRYETTGGVESLCGEFGAERFLYGSWHSRYAMGAMLFYLHQLALDEQALALICAGNLERILALSVSNGITTANASTQGGVA